MVHISHKIWDLRFTRLSFSSMDIYKEGLTALKIINFPHFPVFPVTFHCSIQNHKLCRSVRISLSTRPMIYPAEITRTWHSWVLTWNTPKIYKTMSFYTCKTTSFCKWKPSISSNPQIKPKLGIKTFNFNFSLSHREIELQLGRQYQLLQIGIHIEVIIDSIIDSHSPVVNLSSIVWRCKNYSHLWFWMWDSGFNFGTWVSGFRSRF